MVYLPILKLLIMKPYTILSCCIIAAGIILTTSNLTMAQSGVAKAFDAGKAKVTIMGFNDKFSEYIKNGDSTSLASLYAADAWVLPPNSEPVMKDQVASMWGETMRMGVKAIKLATMDVTGNEQLLVETGKYEVYGDNNKLLDKGKYIVTWKQENGEWKMYRDIWNTSMPLPPAH